MLDLSLYLVQLILVSVPLRGLWFEIQPQQPTFSGLDKFVSVPLRGLWFEMSYEAKQYWVYENPFPSPCGVCGLKSFSFREGFESYFHVSVPLRGLWFEIRAAIVDKFAGTIRFRPLAGFVV